MICPGRTEALGGAEYNPVAMSRDSLVSIVSLISRLLVGLIFLLAAVPKIVSPGDFASSVRAYHVLPAELVVPFTLILPWLELLVAVYLLSGFMGRIGAGGAVVLLLTFIFALVQALATGNTAHACGCFGSGANPLITLLAGGNSIGWWDVIRDGILLILAAWVAWCGPGQFSIDALLARRQTTGASSRSPGHLTWK